MLGFGSGMALLSDLAKQANTHPLEAPTDYGLFIPRFFFFVMSLYTINERPENQQLTVKLLFMDKFRTVVAC